MVTEWLGGGGEGGGGEVPSYSPATKSLFPLPRMRAASTLPCRRGQGAKEWAGRGCTIAPRPESEADLLNGEAPLQVHGLGFVMFHNGCLQRERSWEPLTSGLY